MILDDLKKLIEDSSDDDVEFGDPSCDLSPTGARIQETEGALGVALPPSYLWFVQNYGGGEVYGEEIYSIYPALSEESVGDIVYQTRWARQKKLVKPDAVVVCSNDFGEIFYLDPSETDIDGEYPVVVKAGENEIRYAASFAEFLFKRISDPEG
ncbi:SMI1/KNR4 family protein [Aestuariispira insulae]|uniref:SUKH superfamily protein n=1 Tax=Aestuariispira insulae TaxID=1461337 RepID=A0A3D9H0N6_9PROT|nr:SMI1/KNR4 family protein [Aestuariispira insulae]RED43069.1 SUKH superfamily protein [Aestuariispira insulae]